MKRICIIYLLFCTTTSFAQVKWWGDYDFQVLKGGEDSRWDLNSVPNDYIQFNIHQFDVFMEADLNNSVSLTADLANSPQSAPSFKGIDFKLAYVTVADLLGDALSVSAGKILTPFGSFPKRQLAPDNPFIGYPLFFTYQQNVSPQTGYLDPPAAAAAGSQYGGKLTSVYTGAYYIGAEAFGTFFDGFLDYDFALTNAPLSSTSSDYNVNANPSFQGRLAVHPAIWGSLGASYSVGPYMTSSAANQSFQNTYGSLGKYIQSTYGVDARVSYLYYELNAEYIFNRFKSPYITYNSNYVYASGLPPGQWLDLSSQELLLDLKIDASFYPGIFLALRYNPLRYSNITDPYEYSSPVIRTIAWSPNATRYAVGLGYKPVHGLLLKLDYEKTDIDINPKPDLDVIGLAVVVSF
ncbi:MAG TPA: hypothetical protein VIS48_13645 [Candidatus Kryptonia bacterium]